MYLILLLMTLQATPEQKEVARKLFSEGEVAYNRGDYALAEAKFRAAAQSDPQLPGPARMMGLTLRAEGKCPEAVTWFQQYLKLQPTGRWAPKVKEQIELCRKQLGLPSITNVKPQEGTGVLVVVTSVDGVIIKVDDLQRGITPTEPLQVSPGKHTVLLYRQCYVPRTEPIEIFEGQVSDLKVTMARDPNSPADCEAPKGRVVPDHPLVRVRTNAPAPQVSVDGKSVALSSEMTFETTPGVHEVAVSAPGHRTITRRIVVQRGQERTVEADLQTLSEQQSLRRWGWIALAVAGASGATGAYFGIMESRDFAEARRLADDERHRMLGEPQITTRARLADLNESASSKARIANITLGVSLAALATGVVLFSLEQGDASPEEKVQPSSLFGFVPTTVPSGAGLALKGGF